jgi:5-formyltetrahydrofolate cyclo-ligase
LPEALLGRFRVVAGYVPMGAEFNPGPVLARFATAGAEIVFPSDGERGASLKFRGAETKPALTPDLILAPLLAFDRSGGRLGQGGGSYDRTLAALRGSRPLFVIGLAFAGQEVEFVPREPHDQGLDAILTELAYILVREDH